MRSRALFQRILVNTAKHKSMSRFSDDCRWKEPGHRPRGGSARHPVAQRMVIRVYWQTPRKSNFRNSLRSIWRSLQDRQTERGRGSACLTESIWMRNPKPGFRLLINLTRVLSNLSCTGYTCAAQDSIKSPFGRTINWGVLSVSVFRKLGDQRVDPGSGWGLQAINVGVKS